METPITLGEISTWLCALSSARAVLKFEYDGQPQSATIAAHSRVHRAGRAQRVGLSMRPPGRSVANDPGNPAVLSLAATRQAPVSRVAWARARRSFAGRSSDWSSAQLPPA